MGSYFYFSNGHDFVNWWYFYYFYYLCHVLQLGFFLYAKLVFFVFNLRFLYFTIQKLIFIYFRNLYIIHALRNCLYIITFSTVNIIPSAPKGTPATRSMINKAQYCQRHWQCNIIPLTHSHGACNLVLLLEISLQVWGWDWRNEHGAIFLSYFCLLFILY